MDEAVVPLLLLHRWFPHEKLDFKLTIGPVEPEMQWKSDFRTMVISRYYSQQVGKREETTGRD